MSTSRRGKPFDWISLSLYFSLLIIGWLMIFASSYKGDESIRLLDLSTQYGKQTLWIIVGLAIFGITLLIDPRFWKSFGYPMYGIAILLLVLVLVFGTEIKGTRSWFHLGGFSFQPAEFAKFGTILAVSAFLSYYKTSIRTAKDVLLCCALFLLPPLLILLQPDAGSALVFFSFFILLYREGLSVAYYLIVLSAIALFIISLIYPISYAVNGVLLLSALGLASLIPNPTRKRIYWVTAATVLASFALLLNGLWVIALVISLGTMTYAAIQTVYFRQFRNLLYTLGVGGVSVIFAMSSKYAFNEILQPHQQERINVWLQPGLCDPRGTLYQVLQSKIAIGSGGLVGKGFLNGTMTKLNYVPEQSTDFIFCTIGEEQGFLGVMGVILLFVLLIVRLVILAERAKGGFERHFGYGLAGILFFHFIVNIGMTMGLVPIIGIPLPFLSYGGSSTIIFSLMLGVMIKFDQARGR